MVDLADDGGEEGMSPGCRKTLRGSMARQSSPSEVGVGFWLGRSGGLRLLWSAIEGRELGQAREEACAAAALAEERQEAGGQGTATDLKACYARTREEEAAQAWHGGGARHDNAAKAAPGSAADQRGGVAA